LPRLLRVEGIALQLPAGRRRSQARAFPESFIFDQIVAPFQGLVFATNSQAFSLGFHITGFQP